MYVLSVLHVGGLCVNIDVFKCYCVYWYVVGVHVGIEHSLL